jgi:hypothetical protein
LEFGIAENVLPADGVAGSSGRMEWGRGDLGREGWRFSFSDILGGKTSKYGSQKKQF